MHGVDGARTFDRFEKRGGFGRAEVVAALDREWKLIDRLAAYIPKQLQKPTQLNLLLRDLDAHQLALVAVVSLMHSALVGREDPEMTIDLGQAVQDLAFESKVLRPEKYSRKVGRAAMEARYRSKEWSIENEVQAGNLLLDFCLTALPDAFQLVRGTKGVKAVKISDEKEEAAADILARLILARPVYTPRTSPPKPWSGWRARGHQDGRERASSTFVTGVAARNERTKKALTAAFRNGSMKPHLDGVHALESVPYRINTRVLDAVRDYYPEIMEAQFHKKQRRLEEKKQKMAASGASDKAMHWIIGEIRAHATQFKQDKRQLKVDLAEAERLKGAAFYLELRCDFRGRAKRGEPLQCTTPTGFELINLYEEPQYKIIESKLRGVRVRRKIAIEHAIIRVAKSRNAVAANVIHGLDASHMMLTAIACKRAGIDLMGIHDCYVCLAPQAERLNEIIRQELVQMYDGRDYLTEIRDVALRIAVGEKKRLTKMTEALSHHPLAPKGKRVAAALGTNTPKFIDVPKLGSFDLREILKNVYLFSP